MKANPLALLSLLAKALLPAADESISLPPKVKMTKQRKELFVDHM